jgi:hypothetical protein
MINMDNFVKSKQIKCICKIINSEMDSCNAIDKHWLKKYDNTFGVVVFFFVSAPILNFRYCIHSKTNVEMLCKHGTFYWGHVLWSLKNDILDKKHIW